MVDVPRDVKSALFPKFLERGKVLHVEQYEHLETGPKDKFIVLLNQVFADAAPIYHVLTTSQIDRIPPRFRDHAVIIQPGTVSFFPKATAIQCKEVHHEDYETLQRQYANGTLSFTGTLPEKILEQIDAILRKSIYLSPKIASQVLANYSL